MHTKSVYGFQTGDMVKAVAIAGKKAGTYVDRVAVRASGSFNLQTAAATTSQGISYKHCRRIQRNDGYGHFHHSREGTALPPGLNAGGLRAQQTKDERLCVRPPYGKNYSC